MIERLRRRNPMLRTSAHVLAATLAIIALASTPALSGPFGERFGPDAKYRGGSNSDPVIGGGQRVQGGPWTVTRKPTFDYPIARKPPPPPPKPK
jgi:hypothetical protein